MPDPQKAEKARHSEQRRADRESGALRTAESAVVRIELDDIGAASYGYDALSSTPEITAKEADHG